MSKLLPIFSIFFFIVVSYFLNLYPLSTTINLQQTEQCFLDGQIPCRWTQSNQDPFGHFLYTHLGSATYYLAMFPRLIGLNYQTSLILINIFAIILCFVFSYLNLKQSINQRYSAILSLLISLFSAFLSLTLPLCFLLVFLYLSNKFKHLAAISFSLVILSTPTSKLLSLFLLLFIIIFIFSFKYIKNIIFVVTVGILLSSFYIFPSFIENYYSRSKDFIQDQFTIPITTSGDAQISQYRTRSNFWRFTVTVNQNNPATIIIPIYYYPNWTILIDQKFTTPLNPNHMELTKISIPPGNHTVVAFLQDSRFNILFNLISLITFIYIFIALFPKSAYKST